MKHVWSPDFVEIVCYVKMQTGNVSFKELFCKLQSMRSSLAVVGISNIEVNIVHSLPLENSGEWIPLAMWNLIFHFPCARRPPSGKTAEMTFQETLLLRLDWKSFSAFPLSLALQVSICGLSVAEWEFKDKRSEIKSLTGTFNWVSFIWIT